MFQAFQANPGAAYPTPTPRPMPRVGIVAGHAGNDSGAVCPDGLTEAQVNLEIALRVQQRLLAVGYQVDLLNEFDERLAGYQAQVLVSIHNDSCNYINDEATGFKVAAASSSLFPEKAERLTACLVDRYAKATGLRYHPNTITRDMTEYHTFSEVAVDTPTAIIEIGFLRNDRAFLTQQQDLIAQGIVNGIRCFLLPSSSTPASGS
jgi:N-acetylmuramoyl-L-alanine amidase